MNRILSKMMRISLLIFMSIYCYGQTDVEIKGSTNVDTNNNRSYNIEDWLVVAGIPEDEIEAYDWSVSGSSAGYQIIHGNETYVSIKWINPGTYTIYYEGETEYTTFEGQLSVRVNAVSSPSDLEIEGLTIVNVNNTKTYDIEDWLEDRHIDQNDIETYDWSVSGSSGARQILSENEAYVQIKWKASGTYTIYYEGETDDDDFEGELTVIVTGASANNLEIEGPTTVVANNIRSYDIEDWLDDEQIDEGDIEEYYWSVPGSSGARQILSGNETYVQIKWITPGVYTIYYEGETEYTDFAGQLAVTVNAGQGASNPPSPELITNGICGEQASLKRVGSPLPGVTWYWQGKNPNGTSTSLGSGEYYEPNTSTGSGYYYIRARNNSSGIWSNGSGRSPYVTISGELDLAPDEDIFLSTSSGSSTYCDPGAEMVLSMDYPGSVPDNTLFKLYKDGNYVAERLKVNNSSSELEFNYPGTTDAYKGTTGVYTVTANKDGCSVLLNTSTTITGLTSVVGVVNFSAGETTRCQGAGTTDYNAEALNATSYYWQIDPSEAGGINSSSGLVTWNANFYGTATITVTANGCSSPKAASLTVTVSEWATDSENHIIAWTFKRAGMDLENIPDDQKKVNRKIDYFDGLGRPIQTIMWRASPDGKSIIQPIDYDEFGRVEYNYLPYVNGTTGLYENTFKGVRDLEYESSPQFNFYNETEGIASDEAPYSQNIFEPSHLDRTFKQGAPGSAWQPIPDQTVTTDKVIHYSYEVNTEADKIFLFGIILATDDLILDDDYFSDGELTKTVTTNEEGHAVVEFVDKLGKTVLKRVQVAVNPNMATYTSGEWADTYYVYDDFGDLRYVLPPEAIKEIQTLTLSFPYTPSPTLLARWAFQYKYDGRRRMVEKKVPGAEPIKMIYDDRDRLVLTQDGAQRNNNKWLFTKYDVLNRPIMTGEKVIPTSEATLRDLLDGSDWLQNYAAYETLGGDKFGYTSNSLPKNITTDEILTVTYYDDYTFPHAPTYPFVPELGHIATFDRVKGQVTGTKVKTLDGSNTWLEGVTYYDDRYRVIQSQTQTLLGGVDRVSNRYDFVGNVLQTKTTHTKVSAGAETVNWVSLVNMTDNGGLLTKDAVGYSWNAGASSLQTIAQNSDGSITFSPIADNTKRMIGLSTTDADGNWNTIGFAFYLLQDGTYQIRESGSLNRLTTSFPYAIGDNFKIERDSSEIKYYHNTTLMRTIAAPGSALLVDISVHTPGYTLESVNITNHETITAEESTLTKTFDYDHVDRLINTWHQINDEPTVLLAHSVYNEVGELIEKNLHSEDQGATFAQSMDYRYNIRGWLTSINDATLNGGLPHNDDTGQPRDYFGMNFGYNEDIGIGNQPRYNGDVSGIKWSTDLGLADIDQRANTYTYDVMNRLKSTNHKYQLGTWQNSIAHSVSNINYNLNGSPTEVIRKDLLGQDLDRLSYVYEGNQPVNITDAGDIEGGFKDGNIHASTGINDYSFDDNGNLKKDENKDIIRYSYNHLNLPDSIILTNNRLVKFIYDAYGIKLAQLNYENGALVKRRDYIGEFFYENDTLRYISHEEGRVVMETEGSATYEYTINDRLQNGWLSFTTKTDTWVFEASMESEDAGDEEALFSNVQETRATFSSANHTPGGNEVAELKSSQPIGPALSLHVFPGDTISMEVYAYYEGGNSYSSAAALGTFIGAVAGAFGGVNGGTEAGQQATFDAFDNALGTLGFGGTISDTIPAAYLNYILFDKHLNYKASGFTQISSAANMNHERLAFEDLIMKHEGLLYIYASHESQNGRTFFDDMKVTYAEGPIVGTNTFFPNGGQIDALSFQRPSSPVNRFKYIDRELVDDYGVELYDHLARFYDPWWTVGYTSVDPLADAFESWTPYHYAHSNPMRYIDKTGMSSEDASDGCEGDPDCEKKQQEEQKAQLEKLLQEAKENGNLITIYTAQDGVNQDALSDAKIKLFGESAKRKEKSPGEIFFNLLSKGNDITQLGYELSTTDFQYRNFGVKKATGKIGNILSLYNIADAAIDGKYDMAALEAAKWGFSRTPHGGSLLLLGEAFAEIGKSKMPEVAQDLLISSQANYIKAVQLDRRGLSKLSKTYMERAIQQEQSARKIMNNLLKQNTRK
ncbi:hypothetical protein FNH22_00805 [Fulvivirga sp. M361]|uniref:DUF6443 domain-containing protein n=1 Tax=Fulvivirga sp. M361 TaxID=2594266 RepID=UPI00117A7022|nr:DUF6443 domain-containing protein [Fulvivirga sp. M361]TRX62666.1 hypothetical protein FNH22_00805 [Fulvivirga sp. M361]